MNIHPFPPLPLSFTPSLPSLTPLPSPPSLLNRTKNLVGSFHWRIWRSESGATGREM